MRPRKRFSAQDYNMVAGILRGIGDTFDEKYLDTARPSHVRDTITAHLVSRFAAVFQEDNPAFDLERFLKAYK